MQMKRCHIYPECWQFEIINKINKVFECTFREFLLDLTTLENFK